MRLNILNIGLFYFWFLGFKFQNLEDKGGATTTPLLSAECQIEKKTLFIPTLSKAQGMLHLGDILGTF